MDCLCDDPPLHHPCYREAVYALPDQGEHDAVQSGIFGYKAVELPGRPCRFLLRVEHGATPYRVVAEDQGAWSNEAQRRLEVLGIALFVGVYEDHVERSFAAFYKGGQELVSVANPDLD